MNLSYFVGMHANNQGFCWETVGLIINVGSPERLIFIVQCTLYKPPLNYVVIDSDYDLSPGRRQAIIWTNDGVFSNVPLGKLLWIFLIEI